MNPLEHLAALAAANGRLTADLDANRLRLADARAYLATPARNARFGEAHLGRCRARHSAALARLRANRIEALRLLGAGDPCPT